MADIPTSTGEMIAGLKGGQGLEQHGAFYGHYRGFVVNNKDPQKLGRVQLRVPQIASDNKIETWAWPFGGTAGDDFGDFFIPPNGSPVWVCFENGDPRFPIYTGGHWSKDNAKGKVPTQAKRENPNNRVRKTEKIIMEFDDEAGEFRLSFKEGNTSLVIRQSGEITLTGSNVTFSADQVNSNAPTTTISGVTEAQGVVNAAGTVNANGGLSAPAGGNLSGGITIDGKVFLAHTHSGVDAGGDVSGGVV